MSVTVVPVLRVERGPDAGRVLRLQSGCVLGRQGDEPLSDRAVARQHVRLEVLADRLVVTALSATAPTLVDGQPVTRAELRPGGALQLGADTVLRLHTLEPAPLDAGVMRIRVTRRDGGLQVHEAGSECVVGRDASQASLVLDDSRVSRRHATIRHRADGPTVEDLGSANGTFMEGRRLMAGREYSILAPLTIGDSEIEIDDAVPRGTVRDIALVLPGGGEHAVALESGGGTTVADVAAALARSFGIATDCLLRRVGDGLVPHPAGPWNSVDVRRGERWLLDSDWLGGAEGFDGVLARSSTRLQRPHRQRYVVPVNRPPRVSRAVPALELSPPPLPNDESWRSQGGWWQLIAAVGAASAALIAALVIGGGYIIFAMVALIGAVVATLAGVGAHRSRRVHRQRAFVQHLASFDAQLAATTAELRAHAVASLPDVPEIVTWLESKSERIWERRPFDPDWAMLRIGLASIPTPVRVQHVDRWQDVTKVAALQEVIDRYATVAHHPVATPGAPGTITAIRGVVSEVEALGRALLLQACALHDPRSLRVVLVATDDRWAWVDWLPHVAAVAAGGVLTSSSRGEAQELVRAVRAELAGDARERYRPERGAPAGLLVVLGPGALAVQGADALCRELRVSSAVGLVLCGSDGRLPPDPSCLVSVQEGRARVRTALDHHEVDVVVEPLAAADAARVARLMAPLVDLAAQAPTDAEPSLLRRCLDGELPPLEERWGLAGIRPVAIGTADGAGELLVDLRANGPHGVLCGTTGSGKSELIKTLVIGLALEHGPESLNLFLIDFKGGSTFFELENLPHVVGVVTDLENDRSLAERAFAALDAEIVRRKQLLESARAIDILEYERRPGQEPMPTLVVVIDEFALLKEQFPELVPRLDTVAKQGRSLGVHLMLGTQDPRTVVSSDIRSNTNLWISLRVVLREQSMEILGTPDAANIPSGASGRGFARYGAADEVLGFQTYWVTRPLAANGDTDVQVSDLSGRRVSPPPVAAAGHGTVLASIAAHARDTAVRLAVPPQRQLWLAPLDTAIDGDDLDLLSSPLGLEWVCGLFDDPTQQLQGPLHIDLDSIGNVIAIGAYGAGKSTFLANAVRGLCAHMDPAALHVYVLDGGNGALGLAVRTLPHVAAVVGVDDHERLLRMARRLRVEIERRRRDVDRDGPWVQRPGSPFVVVACDEFAGLRELAERWHDNELSEFIGQLLQSGAGVGVHVIATAVQMTDLRQQMFALFGGRLLLRLSDTAEYRSWGLPELGAQTPAGRGWWVGPTTALVQVATRRSEVDDAWSTSAVRDLWPRPVPAMPKEVWADELVASGDGTPPGLLVGVGGDEVLPVHFDPRLGRPHLLVLGEARSGRTTALAALAASAHRLQPERRLVWLGDPGAHWSDDVPLERLDISDADDFLAALTGPAVVVVDRAEGITDPMLTTTLHELARGGTSRDVWMLVGGRSVDVLRSYEDWLRYLVSLQTVLLLNPTPDAELAFDIRPSRLRPPMLPGRGLLVSAGTGTPVQVARLKRV